MDPLKFVVLDEEDLEVASTHLQDAVLKVSDILWRPQERRVVVALNRFDWESAQSSIGAEPQYRRRRAALRFERVLSCKCRQVDPVRKDAVLNLLAVEFSETEAPSGVSHADFFRRGVDAARGRMPRGRTGRPWSILDSDVVPSSRRCRRWRREIPARLNRDRRNRRNQLVSGFAVRRGLLFQGRASGLTPRRASPIDLSIRRMPAGSG